jgi:hypothetical protein
MREEASVSPSWLALMAFSRMEALNVLVDFRWRDFCTRPLLLETMAG